MRGREEVVKKFNEAIDVAEELELEYTSYLHQNKLDQPGWAHPIYDIVEDLKEHLWYLEERGE